MTRAWIRIEESRVVTESGYSVSLTVAQAYGVPKELFVRRVDDDTYSHVAVVDNVYELRANKDEAEDAGAAFYRSATATIPVRSREELVHLTTHARRRLAEVTLAWDSSAVDLIVPGTDSYTLGGDA